MSVKHSFFAHGAESFACSIVGDGGLPCVFCPIDIAGRLKKNGTNVSVANEFCAIDAYEDSLTVDHAITLLRQARADNAFFYLAVGLHKPHMPCTVILVNHVSCPQLRWILQLIQILVLIGTIELVRFFGLYEAITRFFNVRHG